MNEPRSRLRHIAVDLTPLLPGGSNGGAGLVATRLVRELSLLAPEVQFTLLTNDQTEVELRALEAPNVRQVCVVRSPDQPNGRKALRTRVRQTARAAADWLLPSPARVWLKNSYWGLVKGQARSRTASSLRCDLLFCPFTAPYYHDQKIPLVSIVHDLQHLAYPEFFAPDQRRYRQQHVIEACRKAARVVCVSNYARMSLLASVSVSPERVTTIHHALLNASRAPEASQSEQHLNKLGLKSGRFLLYPANFWPHKNHCTLVEAHRVFKLSHPESDLVIVCTGSPNETMRELAEYAESTSPGGLLFVGYVPEAELSTLYRRCAALIFPSLYEGFGMPVLEAMAVGKPVLCSNVTSLPEIVGDSALQFNPLNAKEIAAAIAAVDAGHPDLLRLAARGRCRARQFGDGASLARTYLTLFEQVAVQAQNS